ncbi:MAG TPA: bifunctional [glutamine synthetase] adenylyltransferase/[glutamine synthetase]-adenylyl-L-tyrosine phosphorylase [Acidimicrobiales bacterium]|nr:bifunctional [glutamine synthetase] adenylyltransferase/[glutamine synthetase]-adenylyl-L-tyrosine phosphorylase [Acidimicrobiales bacterium]
MDRVDMAELPELVERSADPVAVRSALDRVDGSVGERLAADPVLARAFVTTVAASRSATRLIHADPAAMAVLADLDRAVPDGTDADSDELVRWKRLEQLRIMTRDLLGLDDLETTTAALADVAMAVLRASVRIADADGGALAVIGMGKLGGRELNYASDIDVLFVDGEPRQARKVLDLARRSFRVDANLRPEGRDGALTRSIESYVTYWDRWARPWEFQALLKAVPVAGDPEVGRNWASAASLALWDRRFTADDLRSLRVLKDRAETEVVRRGMAEREVKRAPGGIRDIEFAVQVLQLVHGGADPELRSPTTLTALAEMRDAGYVAPDDADGLADAYRSLRRVEHALQIEDEQQTHTLPADRDHRRRIARVLGYRGTPESGPTDAFDRDLARQRNVVRRIHERLYFRPLLDALAGAGHMSPDAAASALASFGFADADRTRAAVRELTRGLTRSSRMMQQLLPLVLDWLSTSPDPDLGLLGLRKLASGEQRIMELANAFRDSPEVARRLCQLLGSSGLLGDVLAANPDLIVRLADVDRLQTLDHAGLADSADRALDWRTDVDDRQQALRRWRARHLLGVAARDVFGAADVAAVGADLAALAEASVEAALASLEPQVPFAVVALGRFAGGELSYASDLDVLFVHEGSTPADHEEGLRVAAGLLRFLAGATPAQRIYDIDSDLRPEGRQGALSRTIDGYAAYYDRWALTWERQAMARARPVAGDPALGARFLALLDQAVWGRPFSAEDEREVRRMKARIERERIPTGEDPEFHLKLGRGSLSDVEFTVQLLQMRTGTRAPSTMGALERLSSAGVVSGDDADVLRAAYRFCERTRNRWWLVGSAPSAVDALPQRPDDLSHLARSLDTSAAGLRDEYRRVTRRARRVVERLFYGRA